MDDKYSIQELVSCDSEELVFRLLRDGYISIRANTFETLEHVDWLVDQGIIRFEIVEWTSSRTLYSIVVIRMLHGIKWWEGDSEWLWRAGEQHDATSWGLLPFAAWIKRRLGREHSVPIKESR